MSRDSTPQPWVPRALRGHAHATFVWQPYPSLRWTFGFVLTRFRRGITQGRYPSRLAYFCEMRDPRRPGMLGILAFSKPELTLEVVVHEVTHAMLHYARTLRARRRRIPAEIKQQERRTQNQAEEVIAYGIQSAPALYRELRSLVRSAGKNSEK